MPRSRQGKSSSCQLCGTRQGTIFEYRNFFYERCQSCGMVSTYPLPSISQLESHYEEKFKSGNYQLLKEYAPEYKVVYEGFVRTLKKLMLEDGRELKFQKVLDIGCFTGDFLSLLQRQGADVYGLELQDEAVEIASQKLPGRVFKADLFDHEFPHSDFDIITLMAVIEHVLDPAKLIGKVSELLKKDGVLMLQTPDSSSLPARIFGRYWPPYEPVEHIHLFGKKSIRLALERAGFGNIQFKPHWKKLPVSYVYQMLRNFGPEFHSFLRPFYSVLPQALTKKSLSFYVGEMIVTARKMD